MVRLLIFFVILMVCDSAFAREAWRYTSFRFVAPTSDDRLPSSLIVGKKTFEAIMPEGSGTHPLWGVEQVYATVGFKQKIVVKREVQLTEKWPVGGWAKVGKGHVLHLKRGESITAYYVVGFDNRERLEIERQIRKAYKTASLGDWLLPSANAGELVGSGAGSSAAGSSQPRIPVTDKTAEIAKEFEAPGIQADSFVKCIAKTAGSSLADKGVSAWEKTKAAAIATYEDPMGAAKAAGSAAKDLGASAWDKTKSGVRATVDYAGEVIGEPSKIYDDVTDSIDRTRQAADAIYGQVKATVKEIEEWPTPVKNAVLCQIAGRLAAERAIGLVAGFSGIGLSIAYTQAMKLMKEVLDVVRSQVPLIQAVLHAQAIPAKERFELIKEYVEGKKSKEQVELALSRHRKPDSPSDTQQMAASSESSRSPSANVATSQAASETTSETTVGDSTKGSPGKGAAAAAEATSLKNLSPEALKDLQRKNRAERSPDVRMQKIEQMLGLPEGRLASRLDANGKETNQERIKLLEIHSRKCARSECTAKEVMSIKEFDKVQAMFPGAPKQRLNDLYRANLLGVDNPEGDREFARLLRQPAKTSNPTDMSESRQQRIQARVTERKSDAQRFEQEIQKLASDPNHSPIKMVEARRQRDLARRDVDRLELEKFSAASAIDKKSNGGAEQADFEALLQKPYRPRQAEASDGLVSRDPREGNAAEEILKRRENREALRESAIAARDASKTPEGQRELSRLLDRPVRTTANLSRMDASMKVISGASERRPVQARYVSPYTGQVTSGEIIGLKAAGEAGSDAKVLMRTKTEDGRVVTREVKVQDLSLDRNSIPLRDSRAPDSAKEVVDRLAEDTSSSIPRLRELDKESSELHRSGKVEPKAMIRIADERGEILTRDAPLRVHEIEQVDAVTAAFSRENMRERLPLKITPTGDIEVRPGVYNRSTIELTPAEREDLQRVRTFVDARRGAPRAREDAIYFDKVKNLDERKIIRERVVERQKQVSGSIQRFTNSSNFELPRTSTFNKYDPRVLASAYGSGATSSIKNALQKAHDIVRQGGSLRPEDVREIQGALRTLRANESVVEKNPDLGRFLDYARDRAAYSQLNGLGN